MLNANAELEAARRVVAILANQFREVRGSQLGKSLKDAGLDTYVKSNFRNVSHFVKERCVDLIQWERPDGGDSIFSSLQFGAQVPNTSISDVRASVLRAFTNPSLDQKIAFNREDQTLFVTFDSNAPSVSGLSYHDLMKISTDFARVCDEPHRTQLLEIIEDQDYWKRWNDYMKAEDRSSLREKWATFRRSVIESLFVERIGELGMPPDDAMEFLRLASRPPERQAQADFRQMPKVSYHAREEVTIRDLARRAIDRMPESEIRLIWLPVGVVFDAAKARR